MEGDDAIPKEERSREHTTAAPSVANGAPSSNTDLLAPDNSQRSRQTSGSKICDKCELPMVGQFVRALGGTYHLECFRCQDCSKTVASKFFPVDNPEHPGQQYPLCETDYFRRLKLLCQSCGGALRGSYITALERKYHIEHFTCSVCPTVFGPQDSYYEHEQNVYCHYHFSMQYAQKCYGCQTSILKQFVEILKNGVNQHWHPECYMIQKFWNVKLVMRAEDENVVREATEPEPESMRKQEALMEQKVNHIWNVLSGFEESSAACISDMLLNVSNGDYLSGVAAAVKFICHVEVLFAALDELDSALRKTGAKSLPYAREAKMLCKKIVAFFALLSRTQDVGVRKLGITQELLSLVTGLAHYLKLLIRISLTGALKLEGERGNTLVIQTYLTQLESLSKTTYHDPHSKSLTEKQDPRSIGENLDYRTDVCAMCQHAIEDDCAKLADRRFHLSCLRCHQCGRDLEAEWTDAHYSRIENIVSCPHCTTPGSREGFLYVSKLSQYVFLLRVALSRLYGILRDSPSFAKGQGNLAELPVLSVHVDDQSISTYDSSGHYQDADRRSVGMLRSDTRSTFHGSGETAHPYATSLNDIRRLRSTHVSRTLSNQAHKPRRSRVMEGPDAEDGVQAQSNASQQENTRRTTRQMKIVEEQESSEPETNQLAISHARSITLDDLNRFVAAEQFKEKRPLSFSKKGRTRSLSKVPGPLHKRQQNESQNGGALDSRMPSSDESQRRTIGFSESSISLGTRSKTYFSELSALEFFIVRHIAVMALEPLVKEYFNLEELLDLIETRKGGFWGKFGKAFKPPLKDEKKNLRKKGVFGIPLEVLCEKESADSALGLGPGQLRVPGFIDDVITAMKGMDMSVEGVFRKNGNIRRLKDLTEQIDKNPNLVNLTEEHAVQLAALLKKFLRDLPDPLMTFKLHRLFVLSQKFDDEEIRYRIIHLTCCLLPKAHRDTMEIVFTFLTWVAQFALVDEEAGSKMDEYNLATVITPNILYSRSKDTLMDESFAAIETVHALIKYSEEFCCVPDDLMSILQDSTLFANSVDLTTKDILKRCEEKMRLSTNGANGSAESASRKSERPKPPKRINTDTAQLYATSKEASAREMTPRSSPNTPVNATHRPQTSPKRKSDKHKSPQASKSEDSRAFEHK